MRAHFGLPSVEAEDKEGKPPISVKFEIPYFTTSGIQVRRLSLWVPCQPIWDFSDLVHYASCFFSFICPTPVNVESKWTSSDRGWNFTCVPFQVRYLKIIEKSGYQALPWVRYITQNGGMWKDTLCLLDTTKWGWYIRCFTWWMSHGVWMVSMCFRGGF